jgi:hypothetical protein
LQDLQDGDFLEGGAIAPAAGARQECDYAQQICSRPCV